MSSPRGHTLPGLMVSGLLVGLITTVLTLALRTAGPTLEAIATRCELDQRCRLAVERALPVLQSAVPVFQEALYAPPDGEVSGEVIFSTNQDWWGQPPTPFAPRAEPAVPYRLLRLHTRGEELVLSEIYGGAPEQVLARGVDVRFHRSGHTLTLQVSARSRSRSWRLETVTGIPAYAR